MGFTRPGRLKFKVIHRRGTFLHESCSHPKEGSKDVDSEGHEKDYGT